jgi:hypothetical protein
MSKKRKNFLNNLILFLFILMSASSVSRLVSRYINSTLNFNIKKKLECSSKGKARIGCSIMCSITYFLKNEILPI